MNEEIKCDICGKTGFKSKAGLAGHKKIAHGEDKRKTVPDEIGKRLTGIEHQLWLMDAVLIGSVKDRYGEFIKKGYPLPRKVIEEVLGQLSYFKKVKKIFEDEGIRVPQTFEKEIENMEKIKQVKVEEKEAL